MESFPLRSTSGPSQKNTRGVPNGSFSTCALGMEDVEVDKEVVEWRAGLDGPAAESATVVLVRESRTDNDSSSPGT